MEAASTSTLRQASTTLSAGQHAGAVTKEELFCSVTNQTRPVNCVNPGLSLRGGSLSSRATSCHQLRPHLSLLGLENNALSKGTSKNAPRSSRQQAPAQKSSCDRIRKRSPHVVAVSGSIQCSEAGIPIGRRWLRRLAMPLQLKEPLLQTAALTALFSAVVLALRDNIQALSGGGGPFGRGGTGGPFWRWGDDYGESSRGPGNEQLRIGEKDDEEGEEEGVKEGENEGQSGGSGARRQLPFAHIGGGLEGRGYEPKGADEDEEEDVVDEEDGELDGEEVGPEEGVGKVGESNSGKVSSLGKKEVRVYSDLPPGFEPEVSVTSNLGAADELAEGEESGVIETDRRGVSSFAAELVEREGNEALQGPSSASFPVSSGGETKDLKTGPSHAEQPVATEEAERRETPPLHSVGNWISGVFGALLGRRSGGPPERESEVLDAQATAQRVLEMLTSQQGDDALAMRGDINALRRLQRETFAQLLEMRDRLSKLEFHTGLRHSRGKPALPAFASHLSSKTKVSGEVSIGVGTILVEDDHSNQTKSSLEHAALRSGTDLKINLETPFRTTDLLMTQLAAGDSHGVRGIAGSAVAVRKIMYRAQLTDWLCLRVAATGAQGADMAEALNPMEGQGLTAMTSAGSALHRRCTGAAVAATARANDWSWLTVGHFLSGWGPGGGADPLCHATLGQVTLRPAPECALAVVALYRHWPTPSLPTITGMHWSEMGPLLLPRMRAPSPQPAVTNAESMRDSYESSTSSMNGTGETWSALTGTRLHGHSLRSYGFAGAVATSETTTLSGWAHVDQANSRAAPPSGRGVQWGVTLSGVPDAPGMGWGLSVGCTELEPWIRQAGLRPGGVEQKGPQAQMEAFLNFTSGKGFTLTPGAVLMKYGQRTIGPAFMLRSTWAF